MTIEEEIEKVEKDIKNADVNKDYGEGILHTLKRWQADRQRLEDENKNLKKVISEMTKLGKGLDTVMRMLNEEVQKPSRRRRRRD